MREGIAGEFLEVVRDNVYC